MRRCAGWMPLVLAAVLVLPPPGTTSRARTFCARWLALTPPEQVSVLEVAEREEPRTAWDPSCRAGLRAGLKHTLGGECRNWKQLMDFEVRALVDRVLEPCRRPRR